MEAHDSVPAQLVRVMVCQRVPKALTLVMFEWVVVGLMEALTALELEAASLQEVVLVAVVAFVVVEAEQELASEALPPCVWVIPFCYSAALEPPWVAAVEAAVVVVVVVVAVVVGVPA